VNTERELQSYDLRGISRITPFLPRHYCSEAASFLLSNGNKVIITTGFYIVRGQASETDGPPGAIALAYALDNLGWDVTFVIDDYLSHCLPISVTNSFRTINFPMLTRKKSYAFSARLIESLNPSLLISIERSGPNSEGTYTNMRGVDISPYTPKIDTLFEQGIPSIGIGDGGNEIGMGLISQGAKQEGINLPWCNTPTNQLIVASVSNWGAYGLLAELSMSTGTPLLPTPQSQLEIVEDMVTSGAVDGVTGYSIPTVDSMSFLVSKLILERLSNTSLYLTNQHQ